MVAQYDLAVIGAGAAGLTASRTAIRLGIKVALIEREKTGGDCTHSGCVPSKALIAAAKVAHTARHAAPQYGIHVSGVEINFDQVMAFVRQTIHDIYEEETPDVMRREGIDVYEAEARFVDPHTVELSTGERITAKYVVLATGSTAVVPEAFKDVPHLTNRNLFEIEQQPEHLLILGGGPIGTEMGQAFNRLGTRVTIIDQMPRLLPNDDEEASQFIMQVLRREGVTLCLGSAALSAVYENDKIALTLADGSTVQGDRLLLALGRKPDYSRLNLEAAGVAVHDGKLQLNDYLQTSQPHIYAAGDATGGAYFTHVAGSQGFTVIRNAFLPLQSKGVIQHIPWATYTDPEVGHAGLTEAQARAQHGSRVQVTRLPMTRNDRAMTEGKREGFLKLVHLPGGKLLGATAVGIYAADLVNEWAWIIAKGGSVSAGGGKMRIYPTFNNFNGVLATERLKNWVEKGSIGPVPIRPLLKRAIRLINR